MDERYPQIKDGCEWVDHEDCLIGDEEGLRNLVAACEEAMEKGESYSDSLGDYVGVKKLDSDWFKDPKDMPQSFVDSVIGYLVIFGILGTFIIGLVAIFQWIYF